MVAHGQLSLKISVTVTFLEVFLENLLKTASERGSVTAKHVGLFKTAVAWQAPWLKRL